MKGRKDLRTYLESIESIVKSLSRKPLTFEEALEYLDISESKLYKMTYRNEIPYYKPSGRKVYFKVEDLDRWMLQNRIKPQYEIEDEANEFITENRRIK